MPKAVKGRSQPKEVSGRSIQAAAQHQNQASASDLKARESATKVLKYLDDYRSQTDTRALREAGYEIDYDRLVGVGANSAVFLAHSISAPQPPAQDKSGQKPLYTPGYDIAVKIVAKKWINTKRPMKTRTGNLKLALALGQTKSDNNVLRVIDVFKTPERIFVFMQYCAYGNVISFIRRNGQVPSKFSRRWSQQMAVALSFLHKFHVAHRNYKLENVLIDDNLNAKLTGFGLSKFCVDLQTKQTIMSRTICGSEPYLAPEMLKEASERCYDPKQADVWAFGVGVFLCVARRYPFEGDNLRALKQEQLAHRYMERDTKRRLRQNVRDLLKMTFIIEPQHRPTMDELCKRSSWLYGGHGAVAAAAAAAKQQRQQQVAVPAVAPPEPAVVAVARVSEIQQQQQQQAAPQSPTSPVAQQQPDESARSHGRAINTGAPQPQQSAIQAGARQATAPETSERRTLSPVMPMSVMASDALPNASEVSRID